MDEKKGNLLPYLGNIQKKHISSLEFPQNQTLPRECGPVLASRMLCPIVRQGLRMFVLDAVDRTPGDRKQSTKATQFFQEGHICINAGLWFHAIRGNREASLREKGVLGVPPPDVSSLHFPCHKLQPLIEFHLLLLPAGVVFRVPQGQNTISCPCFRAHIRRDCDVLGRRYCGNVCLCSSSAITGHYYTIRL